MADYYITNFKGEYLAHFEAHYNLLGLKWENKVEWSSDETKAAKMKIVEATTVKNTLWLAEGISVDLQAVGGKN